MKLWMVSIFAILFMSPNTWAVAILEKITTKFDEKTFVTELIFNKSPNLDDVLVEYINQTVQVNIPNATVRNGKHQKKVETENVKSVYSYQFDKGTLRTRIIYDNHVEASNFEGYVKVSKKGKIVTISVANPESQKVASAVEDFDLVPPLDIEKALNVVKSNTSYTAQDILANEVKIPKNLPEKKNVSKSLPINLEKTSAETQEEKISKDVSNESKTTNSEVSEAEMPVFRKKEPVQKSESSTTMRLVYSLFVIFIFAAALLVFAKWWNKNHKINDKNTKIKILTQHHLGPRKSLAIVRVAGESILIGVTDNNINMIKTLSYIDDEINEDLPSSFNQSINQENSRSDEDVKMQKVTYSPDIDLVKDLRKQIAGKLKNLKDI